MRRARRRQAHPTDRDRRYVGMRLLADPPALAAAVVEILKNAQWRAELGVAARKWAENEFSLSALSANMLQVYRELLN